MLHEPLRALFSRWSCSKCLSNWSESWATPEDNGCTMFCLYSPSDCAYTTAARRSQLSRFSQDICSLMYVYWESGTHQGSRSSSESLPPLKEDARIFPLKEILASTGRCAALLQICARNDNHSTFLKAHETNFPI